MLQIEAIHLLLRWVERTSDGAVNTLTVRYISVGCWSFADSESKALSVAIKKNLLWPISCLLSKWKMKQPIFNLEPTFSSRMTWSSDRIPALKYYASTPARCRRNRKSCRRLSYLSTTRIPAFNILAANLVLGLKLKTHRLIQGLMDALLETLYTASMSLHTFRFLSAVYPVYF